MTASLWWLISNDRVRETPGTLRSIGKVVPDLGEPDQVAGGVPRLDGNLNPVLSGSVMVLLFDLARGGHGFPNHDRPSRGCRTPWHERPILHWYERDSYRARPVRSGRWPAEHRIALPAGTSG